MLIFSVRHIHVPLHGQHLAKYVTFQNNYQHCKSMWIITEFRFLNVICFNIITRDFMTEQQKGRSTGDGWDVYSVRSHLIPCHYARAIFYLQKKGEGTKDRDLNMPPNIPEGICGFSLVIQWDTVIRLRVWPWRHNTIVHREHHLETRVWKGLSSLMWSSQSSA